MMFVFALDGTAELPAPPPAAAPATPGPAPEQLIDVVLQPERR